MKKLQHLLPAAVAVSLSLFAGASHATPIVFEIGDDFTLTEISSNTDAMNLLNILGTVTQSNQFNDSIDLNSLLDLSSLNTTLSASLDWDKVKIKNPKPKPPVSPVPEPGAFALMGVALLGLGLAWRRTRRTAVAPLAA